MSNGWETTNDDVLNVIHEMGRKASGSLVESIHNSLDHFKIETAVLQGYDLETQTYYAYEEIKKQIIEGGLI